MATPPSTCASKRITDIESEYAASFRMLCAYARRKLADEAEAEDVAQDTILQALLHLDRYDPQRGSFKNWLLGIARYQLLNRQRRKSPSLELLQEPVGEAPSPEAQVFASQRHEAFVSVFSRLKPKERQVLSLIYVKGHSHREVAARLSTTEQAISAYISRLRSRCAQKLFHRAPKPSSAPARDEELRSIHALSKMFALKIC